MFAQTQPVSTAPGPLIILSSVDSSNNYAMAKLHAGMLNHSFAFLAHEQTSGKGQRGKQWISLAGKNITLSIALPLQHAFQSNTLVKLQSFPFLFSAATALGCYDFIKGFNVHDIKIKWPNDIYIGDRKAGGILIENSFQAGDWQWSVIGIGINLNQQGFDVPHANPVSIHQATGLFYNVRKEADRLHRSVLARLHWLQQASPPEIMVEYNRHLYRRNEEIRLKRGNAVFPTTILHVDTQGKLHTNDVLHREFSIGEVELITG